MRLHRFLRWVSGWPLGRLHALGTVLGWATWLLSPIYRRRIADHARLAGIDPATYRQSVAEAGRMVAETPWLWLRPQDSPLGDLVRWEGAELLEAVIARGCPLLLLTPHMGSFEVAGRAYAERFGQQKPMTALYRPSRLAWIRPLQQSARARPGMPTAPATLAGVRQMLRALQRGEAVGLLPDQVPPAGQGVWAPFFGRPAYTMTLAPRLVAQTGAGVLVLRSERLPGGRGYVIHVSELVAPLPGLPVGDDAALVAAATVINRTMEEAILKQPSQYLWGYNRYKLPRSQGETK